MLSHCKPFPILGHARRRVVLDELREERFGHDEEVGDVLHGAEQLGDRRHPQPLHAVRVDADVGATRGKGAR